MAAFQAFNYVGTLPERLICPICFEIPKCKVYQCVNGHIMCNICYKKLSVCSSCREKLDKGRPIRNRHFEMELDEYNVHCSFKCNGCKKIVKKGLLASHQANCCFNFDKFGSFVNICQTIGFFPCDFKINNGNTKEGVVHLVSQHGCKLVTLSKGERFDMELANFQKLQKAGLNDVQSWTPIIAEWKDDQYYILNIPILRKTELGFFSLFLPYPERVGADSDRTPRTCAFLIENCNSRVILKQMPSNLKNCNSLLEDISFPFCVSTFHSFTKKGSLMVACSSEESGISKSSKKIALCMPKRGPSLVEKTSPIIRSPKSAGKRSVFGSIVAKSWKKVKEFAWLGITFGLLFAFALGVAWLSYQIFNKSGSHIAREIEDNWHRMKLSGEKGFDDFTTRMDNYLLDHRNFSLRYLQALFEEERPVGIASDLMDSLKLNAICAIAKIGSLESIKYLIRKRLHRGVKYMGRNLPFWTVYDHDHRIGMEKTKLLVNNGLSLKLVDNYKKNLLHHVARDGTDEFIEYFLLNGVEPNWRDFEGLTPLHHVFYNKNKFWVKSVELLLEYGADPYIRDDERVSAWQRAQSSGDEEVIDIFQKHEWMTKVFNPRYFLSGSKTLRMCSKSGHKI